MSLKANTPTKPKTKNKEYRFDKVVVDRWEMIGVVKGKQQFEFTIRSEYKSHLGEFVGRTRIGDDFVIAIKAHPDYLYDVVLKVTPSGVCTMMDGKSFKSEM